MTFAGEGGVVAVGGADVVVGGGHDSNMFVQVAPDMLARAPLVSDWFVHSAPSVSGALVVGGWRFELSCGLDHRASDRGGQFLFQEAELAVALPWRWRVQPRLAFSIGRFDASQFPEDRFVFAGGEAGGRVQITDGLRLTGAYRLVVRDTNAFGIEDQAERDWVHQAEARLGWRASPGLEMGLGSSHVRVVPTRAAVVDDGTFRLARLGPEVEGVWGRLTAAVGVWGGRVSAQEASAEWFGGTGVGALVRLTSHLDATAVLDWSRSFGTPGGLADSLARRYFLVGVAGHVAGRRSLRREEPPDLRPTVEGTRVRFRYRSVRATSVQVLGSWNDWETSGGDLVRAGADGLWELWTTLPAGTHRYRFLVDGRPEKPPSATRYVVDDFGGEDGIVDVPRQAASLP